MQRWFRIVAVSSALLGAAASADAQPAGRFYAGAAIGGFRVSADEVDGSAAAASVLGGVAATPWLDVEVDVAFPASSFTRSYGGDALSLSFAPHGASREELERFGIWLRYDKRRDVTASLSGVAIFHPSRGRVKPGFIAGVTSQHVRSRTDLTPVRVGPGVDPANPWASPRAETDSRIIGALTLGAQLAIAATSHLYVVPDVRFDYGSIGDEINNALRSSVRVMWRF
jgi:outer membrane protein with beta-barrel domain